MHTPRAVSSVLIMLLAWPASVRAAQGASAKLPSVTIPRIDRTPTLGDFPEMEPNGWARTNLAKIEGFIQREPKDGEPATQRTEVYAGYDKKRGIRGTAA